MFSSQHRSDLLNRCFSPFCLSYTPDSCFRDFNPIHFDTIHQRDFTGQSWARPSSFLYKKQLTTAVRSIKANVFLSIIASINLVCFFLILPRATGILASRFNFPASKVDALVSEVTAILFTLGSFWMSVATQILPFLFGQWLHTCDTRSRCRLLNTVSATMIFAAGFGFRFSLLSLITSLVDPSSIGQAYTLVAILEAAGGMLEGLGLQKVFAISIDLGGAWLAWWMQ